MATNEERYLAIQAELLLLHETTGAYNADDQLATDEMNEVNVVEDQKFVSVAIIFDAILNHRVEWDAPAISAEDQQWVRDILNVNTLLGVPTLPGTPARTQLTATLGPLTQAEIGAAIPHTVSRASQLNLGLVQIGDIQNARAL
jgi:hypothetical protein